MKVIIDTNIIIDYLADRMPFADYAEKIIKLGQSGKISCFLTANSITDIYYIMRKIIGRDKTLECFKILFSIMDISDINKNDIFDAMKLDVKDFEDALLAVCANRIYADYIVTRDIDDFKNSTIKAINPQIFLADFFDG